MTVTRHRATTVLLWVVTALEALIMALAGAGKFSGDHWAKLFIGWGYPVAFTYVIGAAEVVGALLLLVPKLASWAAIGLSVIMIGAIVTQVRQPGPGGWTSAAVHLVLLVVIGTGRWPARSRG